MAMTPKDAEYLGSLKWNLEEICRAYGVPQDLVGGQRTYENVDAAMKAKPGMDRANLLAQLKASLTLIESAENKGKPFGWGSDALWEQTMDLMKTYRELKTDVPTKAHYDYSFLAPLTQ